MPLYEYKCTECGKEFEVMQKFSDEPVAECAYCSGRVEKLISLSSFHLKGGGWYKTDYAGKGASSACEAKDAPGGSGDAAPAKKPGCGGCPQAS